MRAADLPRADELRKIAGWNQRPGDWQRFLELSPQGCFVAEVNDAIAGTVTTIQYGRKVAWIGMLLVAPRSRGGGIGKALLMRAVEHLQNEKIASIKLDATPLGEGLYRKMGFKDEWSLTRYKGAIVGIPNEPPSEGLDLTKRDTVGLIELDAAAFGTERTQLLESLLSSAQHAVAVEDQENSRAFGFLRSGSVADYLGPVVARNWRAASKVILELASRSTGRPFYWDIPAPNQGALSLAQKLGFAPERPLLRMYLGRNDHPGDVTKYFGIADPSLG